MDVGVEFGHYRVLEHIGRGGMADVWSARDKRLSRTVAIKTIARDLSIDLDPIRLFEREAKTIAALEHPHILPIYEFGDYQGQLFIVMRYVSGGSLEDVLEKGPLSLDETLRVARAVGQALDYAHNSKVIHLDLKPSNILLDSYQSPYLADFGLATMLGPEGRAANPGSGTLLYMAPEQLTSDQLDLRADIYSFAILIFHMVTGQLPFDAAMPLALKQLQLHEDMPDVRSVRPSLPAGLTPILRRASEVDPNRRPASVKEVLQALESVIAPARVAPSLDTATMPLPTTPSSPQLDQLISGPIEGLISRPIEKQDKPLETGSIDELITGPLEGLISRPGASKPVADDLFSGTDEGLISRPADKISRPPERASDLKIDVGAELIEPLTPDQLARREAEDIYHRARRVWAHGQGRFLLGVTDYILIADYYANAEQHRLEVDEAGMQMLLRGAIEYDYNVELWWSKLPDDSRRWTALHAVRSENAPARVRAMALLEDVMDVDPPQIPRRVAQALQTETNKVAQLAAIRVLEKRARRMPRLIIQQQAGQSLLTSVSRLTELLRLTTTSDWVEHVYGAEIDLLLAQKALDLREPDVAEAAARAIGRIRSVAAVREIALKQRAGAKGALRALAFVRDEAPSLPPVVSQSSRIYAWLANTWRRISDDPLHSMWRFLLAAAGSSLAMGVYVWASLASGIGSSILIAEVWGRAVSIGLTFGVLMGLVVLFSSELPDRLRGFWLWWARLIISGVFGFTLTTFTWGAFNFLVLNDQFPVWEVMAWAGAGAAIGFMILSLWPLPGMVRALILGAAMYLPLYIVWDQYWNAGTLPVPVIYFFEYQQVFTWLIPIVAIIALSANLQAIFADVRSLLRRIKRANPSLA